VKKAVKLKVRKKRKYTRNNYISLILCILILGGFLYTLTAQQLRLMSIRREDARCKEEIALKEKELERLEEKAKFSSSDRFYEEKARDEGYVREDETLFVVGN